MYIYTIMNPLILCTHVVHTHMCAHTHTRTHTTYNNNIIPCNGDLDLPNDDISPGSFLPTTTVTSSSAQHSRLGNYTWLHILLYMCVINTTQWRVPFTIGLSYIPSLLSLMYDILNYCMLWYRIFLFEHNIWCFSNGQ